MSFQNFVLQVNSASKYAEMEAFENEHNGIEHFTPMRRSLIKLFHSYRFHLLIIALVVVDCLIVVTELIIELNILNKNKEKHSSSEDAAHILHYISLAILCLFTIEIILKIYALRIQFFKSWMEMFDAFVIIVSLVIDIVFLQNKSATAFIGDLIIVLRLWRIVRVIHGIVLSVKTPIEHNLEKERKHREEAESRLHHITEYASSLQNEILQLRQVLNDNGVKVDLPSYVNHELLK